MMHLKTSSHLWEVCRLIHVARLLCSILISIHYGNVFQHLMHVCDIWTHSVITKRFFRCGVDVSIESVHTVIYPCVIKVKLKNVS